MMALVYYNKIQSINKEEKEDTIICGKFLKNIKEKEPDNLDEYF
jgi:hypothetical protein